MGVPIGADGPHVSPFLPCLYSSPAPFSDSYTEFLSHYSSSSGALLAPGHVLRYDCLVQHFTQSSGPVPEEGSTPISTGYREAWGLRGELDPVCLDPVCLAHAEQLKSGPIHAGPQPPLTPAGPRGPSDTLHLQPAFSSHLPILHTPLRVSVCECLCRHASPGVCVYL